MGGIFGVASKNSCVLDLFFGIDYHSHLGTRRGGMAVYDKQKGCLLYTSPSPRDLSTSRMPSSA